MSNIELTKRRNDAVPRGISSATSIFAARARNAELWDADGKRFIDFAGGIAVVNTGHCHPRIVQAVTAQAQTFTHTAFQVAPYEIYISLAERLNKLAPISNAKTIFMTTGAEAVENAVKIARAHTKRSAVIAFSGGFHGRSLLTMGLTGKVVPYKGGFGSFPSGIFHAPFPIPHHGISEADSLRAIEHIFIADVAPNEVAAIILEPVQGEGGFYQAPKSFMKKLREICDQHGICLICDEVQAGFARTGKLFASEHYDIEPDLMTVAKALAGGVPLSGVIGKAEIMDAPGPGGLGGTYGGSPIGCAAAHAVLDIIEEENLCERAVHIGEKMQERLRAIKQSNDAAPIGDIRGIGAMVAFELVKERGGNIPDAVAAKALTVKALEHGLIILSCGIFGNTIRLLAPLTIEDSILEEGLGLLESALKQKAA